MSYKILTVDDSKMVRIIVARSFQPYACEVFEAGNGTDALATTQAVQPELIFLDINRAAMNGLVVLEKLREIESLQATTVIMLTAESGNNSIERGDKLKAASSIAKPFKGEQLLPLARQVLDRQTLAAA